MADIALSKCSSDVSPEIFYVIGQLTRGGAESHLAMVTPALVRKGWRVSVFSLKGDGAVSEALRRGGAEIVPTPRAFARCPDGGLFRIARLAVAAYALWKALRQRRPAIAHFFLPAAYMIGAPLAALTAAPVRVMSRRSLNVYQSAYPFVASFEKVLHRRMTAVLGNSLSVVRELHNCEGVPVAKLGLIYNGVDACRLSEAEDRAAARAALRLPADALVFVIVANLIPYKGHADLLDALAIANRDLPANWRLLVVGRDDGIGPDLQRRAISLGLAANVNIMGPREDVPRLLAAADIGLLCSHEEGFSNALLEGMAVSLPMIATDVGGNAEAIRHGESGLIVPAHNSARLAQAITQLAGDASLRAGLGAAARARVQREFSYDRCVEAYDALYRALLAGRCPGDVPRVSVAGRL